LNSYVSSEHFCRLIWQPVLLASSSLLTKQFYRTQDKTPLGKLISQPDAELSAAVCFSGSEVAPCGCHHFLPQTIKFPALSYLSLRSRAVKYCCLTNEPNRLIGFGSCNKKMGEVLLARVRFWDVLMWISTFCIYVNCYSILVVSTNF
jgi:hypothetical protein